MFIVYSSIKLRCIQRLVIQSYQIAFNHFCSSTGLARNWYIETFSLSDRLVHHGTQHCGMMMSHSNNYTVMHPYQRNQNQRHRSCVGSRSANLGNHAELHITAPYIGFCQKCSCCLADQLSPCGCSLCRYCLVLVIRMYRILAPAPANPASSPFLEIRPNPAPARILTRFGAAVP